MKPITKMEFTNPHDRTTSEEGFPSAAYRNCRPADRDRGVPTPWRRRVVLAGLLGCCLALVAVPFHANEAAAQGRKGDTLVAQATVQMPRVGKPAPDAVFQANDRSVALSSLRGKKVVLWLFSTWCASCAQGVNALARIQPKLQDAGITVVALRNPGNGGFSGPSITEFFARYGAPLAKAPNWLLGQASDGLGRRYNPKGYPDVYFLIDASGVIRAVDTAPSATLDRILRFAGHDG